MISIAHRSKGLFERLFSRQQQAVPPDAHDPDLSGILQQEAVPPDAHNPNLYDILLFPVVDWHDRFQRPHHLSLEFARRGYRVFSFSRHFERALCACGVQGETVAPNLFYVRLPGSFAPPDIYADIPDEVQLAAMENGIRQLSVRFGFTATLSIVDYPFWAPLVRRLPNNVVLYDCMDDYASFANAGRPARELESAIVREADISVCSSARLQELARTRGREAVLIRNGVDYRHFAAAPPRLALEYQRPVAGYWGATAEWTDIELLIRTARSLPGVDFVLIGEIIRIDVSELAALPNVTLVGEVPYAELPHYLHAFDVCLLPYRVCDYALASDPMKIWEYMCAGKPVVAVRFREIERLADLITLTSTTGEFVAGIVRAIEGEEPARAEARKAFARENTWSPRCEEMLAAVEPCFPKVSVVVLAHDQCEFTRACLWSLDRFSLYPNLEIVVVDNASADDTPVFLREWAELHPNGRTVRNELNLGFSGGNNAGARQASGEFLVFLNNDCFVTAGWVGDMLRHFRLHPRLGLLGPVTNSSGNESVIPIQYKDVDEMAVKARAYTVAHRGERTRPAVLHFFCVMLPRRVWEEVGELDEHFGRGLFEDDDYTLRVRQAGYETACAEDVFIHHHHSASFGRMSKEEYDCLFERNRAYFERKWGVPWVPPAFRKEMQP